MSMTHHISNQGIDHLVSQSPPWWVHWQQKAQSLNLKFKIPWSTAKRPKANEKRKNVIKKEKPQNQQNAQKTTNQAKWQRRGKKNSKSRTHKTPLESTHPDTLNVSSLH
jgi:hypothetical protein